MNLSNISLNYSNYRNIRIIFRIMEIFELWWGSLVRSHILNKCNSFPSMKVRMEKSYKSFEKIQVKKRIYRSVIV